MSTEKGTKIGREQIEPLLTNLFGGMPVFRYREKEGNLDVIARYPNGEVVLKEKAGVLEEYDPTLLPFVERYLAAFAGLRD